MWQDCAHEFNSDAIIMGRIQSLFKKQSGYIFIERGGPTLHCPGLCRVLNYPRILQQPQGGSNKHKISSCFHHQPASRRHCLGREPGWQTNYKTKVLSTLLPLAAHSKLFTFVIAKLKRSYQVLTDKEGEKSIFFFFFFLI